MTAQGVTDSMPLHSGPSLFGGQFPRVQAY